jgi:hypothetical protein
MRAIKIGLRASKTHADELREIRSPRAATCVLVDSLVQFTKQTFCCILPSGTWFR